LSSQNLKSNLKRLERVSEVRRAFVIAAEARVREADQQVRQFAEAAEEIAGKMRDMQEEFSYVQRTTGDQIQGHEQCIRSLGRQSDQARQDLDRARMSLELSRAEWTEAMREQKIVERVKQRRLRDWNRRDDAEKQKATDENSVTRHTRRQMEP
jgi:flagellar FliJ protein